MARIPRSFARRARSTASIFLGTPSGSECACISIAPPRVCAFADSEKTRNIAASCDLMDVPFIEQVSLELGVDLPEAAIGSLGNVQLCYCTTRCHATSECEHRAGAPFARPSWRGDRIGRYRKKLELLQLPLVSLHKVRSGSCVTSNAGPNGDA